MEKLKKNPKQFGNSSSLHRVMCISREKEFFFCAIRWHTNVFYFNSQCARIDKHTINQFKHSVCGIYIHVVCLL